MSDERVRQEMDRIADVIVPYLCERTGLSRVQVEQFLEAQETFWETQPHVVGRMTILGFDVEPDDAG